MKTEHLKKNAFYNSNLSEKDKEKFYKILGISVEDFKPKTSLSKKERWVDEINMSDIQDDKIRSRILKLYFKDKDKQIKDNLKITKQIAKTNKKQVI